MSKAKLHRIKKHLYNPKGQSLVEFAIILPILLLMLLAAFDVGRMYFAFVAMQNAAGEGALYAAINPTCIHASDSADCADPNNAEYRAKQESPAGNVDWQRVTVEVSPADTSALHEGDPITFFIHYEYDILTPLISPMFPDGKLRLTARSVQNILNLEE
jgi:Flp pilus assembly protein TadG